MTVPSLRRRLVRINGERYELKPAPEMLSAHATGRLDVPAFAAALHPGDPVPQRRVDRARPLGRWLVVRKHDDRAVGELAAARDRGGLRLTISGVAARDAAATRELPDLLQRWARTVGVDGPFVLRIGGHAIGRSTMGNLRRVGDVLRATRPFAGIRAGAAAVRSLDATLSRLGVPADYGTQRDLPRIAEPRVLAPAGIDLFGRVQWLAPAAADAWRRMRAAAQADGIALQLVSAFRSAEYQSGLIERKLARGATIDDILEVNAAPGYSQHHAGRAIDVAHSREDALEESFERTDAFRWLTANAAAFGYSLSYPRDNPHGIAYEPWHWFYGASGT